MLWVGEISESKQSWAILSGYKAQKELIDKEMQKQTGTLNHTKKSVPAWVIMRLKKVRAKGLGAFQGSEADMILMSMACTTTIGFNSNLKRLNIAISRARSV